MNLIYNIGEIQYKFLSLPTIEFPTRISVPLHRLRKIKALHGNEVWNKDIYSEANGNRLMRNLGSDYNNAYEEIEKRVF